MLDRQIILAASVAIGTAILGIVVHFWRRGGKKYYPVGKVTQLSIYPIKSCREVNVEESECSSLGMRYGFMADRHWMVTTSEYECMPLKIMPRLILVQPSYHGDELHLDVEGMETLKIPMMPSANNNDIVKDCVIYGHKMQCVDYGEDAANWFSKVLNKSGVRLVRYLPGMKAKPLQFYPGLEVYGKSTDLAVFADASAYLLMSEDSHEAVNKLLSEKEKIPLLNFRPNIIISGNKPFDEDLWNSVKIGNNCFRFALICPRCSATTVDRTTATLSRLQPLKELRKFRLTEDANYKKNFPGAPLYGIYLQLDEYNGPIKVGDIVYASYK